MTRHENDGYGRKGLRSARPARDKSDAAKSGSSRDATPSQLADGGAGSDRQRIAKRIARAGLCSRRDAEAWIVEGRVSLNGTVLTSPAMDVGEEDDVLVDGIPLPAAEKTRLFLFHKPAGLITSDHDPEGRPTVPDFLRERWPEGPRVVTVGRLDFNTEGLLLLTNDGGLARTLELPSTGWVRRYRVRAKGGTDQGVLDRLRDGVTIEGIDYAGIDAKLDRIQGANCWLTMGLREGKNREVKRVLEHVGLEVNRLIRLSFGPFQLLDLPEGHVEEVKTRVLRDQLGPALAEAAGVDFSEPAPSAPIVPPPQPATRTLHREPSRDRPDRDRASREHGERSPKPSRKPVERGRASSARAEPAADPQKRERPAAGPRRHVSTLRADRGKSAAAGPRKRLELTATTDRKNRSVKVERLVSKTPSVPRRERIERKERSAPRSATSPSQLAGRQDRAMRDERREPTRAPRREQSGSAGPMVRDEHGSRSAQGKRERIARSGGAARPDRPARPRAERSLGEKQAGRPERQRERALAGRGEAEERRPGGKPRRPPSPDGKSFGGKSFASESFAGKSFASKSFEGKSSESRSSGGDKSFGGKPGGKSSGPKKFASGRSPGDRSAGGKWSEPRQAQGRAAGSAPGDRPRTRGRAPGGGKPAQGRDARPAGRGDARPSGPPRNRPGGKSRPPRAPRS